MADDFFDRKDGPKHVGVEDELAVVRRQIGDAALPPRPLSRDASFRQLRVKSRINHPRQHVVDPQVKSLQGEEARRHNAQPDRQRGAAVVGQLVLEQRQLRVELNRLPSLQLLHVDTFRCVRYLQAEEIEINAIKSANNFYYFVAIACKSFRTTEKYLDDHFYSRCNDS